MGTDRSTEVQVIFYDEGKETFLFLLSSEDNLLIIYCAIVMLCSAQMLSRVRLFVTLWTIACQAPLSMGFSRQESWGGMLSSRGSSQSLD